MTEQTHISGTEQGAQKQTLKHSRLTFDKGAKPISANEWCRNDLASTYREMNQDTDLTYILHKN